MKCELCKKEKKYEELWHIAGQNAPKNVRGKYVCNACEKKVKARK